SSKPGTLTGLVVSEGGGVIVPPPGGVAWPSTVLSRFSPAACDPTVNWKVSSSVSSTARSPFQDRTPSSYVKLGSAVSPLITAVMLSSSMVPLLSSSFRSSVTSTSVRPVPPVLLASMVYSRTSPALTAVPDVGLTVLLSSNPGSLTG